MPYRISRGGRCEPRAACGIRDEGRCSGQALRAIVTFALNLRVGVGSIPDSGYIKRRKSVKPIKPRTPAIQSTTNEPTSGSRGDLYRSLVDSLNEHAVFAISPAGVIMTWN